MVGGNDKPIIVVTGCGSSGTKYATKFFKRGGVHIGHEQLGPDGISSWYITPSFLGRRNQPPETKPPYKGIMAQTLKEHFGYERGSRAIILHQVRYPLNAISTFQRSNKLTWAFVSKILDFKAPLWRRERVTKEDDDYCLKCCMNYWLRWNMMAERIAHITYRVEDISEVFNEIVKLVERPELIEHKDFMLKESTLINSKKSVYEPRTWDDLKTIDEALTNDIVDLGWKYGYEINI